MITAGEKALYYRNGRESLKIEAWGKNGIRVRSAIIYEIPSHDRALLPDHEETPSPAVSVDGDKGILRNGKLECRIKGPMISFGREDGTLLLGEQANGSGDGGGPSHFPGRDYKPLSGNAFRLRYRLCAYDNEHICGMGQYQDGLFDKKARF